MKTFWNSDLYSPGDERISINKPAHVMKAARISPSIAAIHAPLASREQLVRAHSLAYVVGIMNGRVENGFGETGAQAAAHLPHILAANGVMIAAVEAALEYPKEVVFAPVSGFHHAGYEKAEGFCTFNGLMVAIACARLKRRVPNVLIIDGDIHYGNGTDDIVEKLALSGILNLTHRGSQDVVVRQLDPRTWEPTIRGLLTNREWDLVIYQAGADAHIEEKLHGGYLNDDDWEARDRLVFQYCARLGFPLVFNLAGGYNGEKTIELHAQTVRHAEVFYKSTSRA